MKKFTISIKRATVFIVSSILLGTNFFWLAEANAASLATTDFRLNRMSSSTDTSARLVFKTSSTGATSVVINMNGADSTTWTAGTGTVAAAPAPIGVAGCDQSPAATALPGTLAATGSGSTITVTGVTSLAAATTYCVDLTATNALHTPTAAGEYHPTVTVGSDSTTVAVRVVTNDSIVVTAVVPPTFNFVLSGSNDAFTTNLSSGAVTSTGGVTATVNTNAKTGWTVWAKDANTGLLSTVASKTIAGTTPGTSATLAANTEGYTMGVTTLAQGTGAGTASLVAAYDATGAASGSGLDATLRQVASSNGSASNAVLTLKEKASINTLTPAASDYTDTITLIGSGKF